MLNKICNRTNINMTLFIERLKGELSINQMKNEEKKKLASEQLIYSIYDTMIIILDTTHQNKVQEGLYTTWIRMIKDYWYLNKYDKQFLNDNSISSNNDSKVRVKSIQIGDTTTTFSDTSSQIDINGTTYNTGTVDFDTDILVEKYKKDLYRHRKIRW